MSNTKNQGQNNLPTNNEREELYQVFTEATLISDTGIEIEDKKLKKIIHSVCKSKNLKRTRALLKGLINELSPDLFKKTRPNVSVPLIYSPQGIDELAGN